LSILFVGDRAMRKLNHAWRGKDKTTDVLSFSFREGRFTNIRSRRYPALRDCGMSRSVRGSSAGVPPEMLGDIVISVPVARTQAVTAGHALSTEIERLLVHALAHLLGYDHEQGTREARRMAKKEQQLLKRLG
jgi:probable rRNA maturation factor